MTLTTQSIKAVAQGNSANTVWPFTFLIPEQGDLVVTVVDVASGNETTIPPINYGVSGLGNPVGGFVTYPLGGSPLTAASLLVVERFVPDVQETDLTNQGGVYPADIEDALDYLTMITQQLQDQVERSIVFSVADSVAPTLPVATARANKVLGFNSNGDPVAVDGIMPGTTVSAAMIPVVTAPTTAQALTALGLPGALLDLLIPAGTIWDYAGFGTAPTGFIRPFGQPCTALYPVYRAMLIAGGSPFGTNGVDPLLPDLRSVVVAGRSNMGGTDNGLLPGGTVFGAVLGAATRTLVGANLPPYTPTGSVANGAITINGVASNNTFGNVSDVTPGSVQGSYGVASLTASQGASSFTGAAQGGTSSPVGVIQPTIVLDKIIKVH